MSSPTNSRQQWFLLLETTARESPYPLEAFLFVLDAFPQSASPGVRNHIDGGQFCWRLHDQALRAFGPRAREQLQKWGIRSCEDFGRIVYALIDSGLAAKTEQDSIEDFQDVFDFETAFRAYHDPLHAGHRSQWRLSSLFLITTVIAVAFAGFGKAQGWGPFGTLSSSWLALIGFYCLVQGIRDRSNGWIAIVCVGVAFAAVGCGMFFAVILNYASPR